MTAVASKKRSPRKANRNVETIPATWPGQIWDGWTAGNDTRTPNYLLVSARDDIDAPIALIQVAGGEGQEATESYHVAINAAVAIAQRPNALDSMDNPDVTDLRRHGQLDSTAHTPEEFADLHFAPWGSHDSSVSACRPFDRFALAHQLSRLAGLLGITPGAHATITFGDGEGCRVQLGTAKVERGD